MATRPSRQTLYQFGASVNGASEVGIFGSAAAGSATYTASITLMQSLAAWNRGWAAETIANNRPFLEDMNAVDCVFGYQLFYMMTLGIPEFDTSGNTLYFLNSICQSGGTLYQCTNDNSGAGTNAAVSNVSYWKNLLPITGVGSGLSLAAGIASVSNILGSSISRSASTNYQAATDGYVIAVFNWQSNNNPSVLGYSDSNPSPSRILGGFSSNSGAGGNPNYCSFCFPVKKNDYYRVTYAVLDSFAMYFIPSGS